MRKIMKTLEDNRDYPSIIKEWNTLMFTEIDKAKSSDYREGLKTAQTLLAYLLNKEREDMFLYE